MSKQTIEIEVPEGYEATGEYRNPDVGEFYLCELGVNQRSALMAGAYPILRKVEPHDWGVEFEDWVKWLTIARDGSVWAHKFEPTCGSNYWNSALESCLHGVKFNKPPYDDWRQAKWEVGK